MVFKTILPARFFLPFFEFFQLRSPRRAPEKLKEAKMNYQYRADFWPGKITQKVRIVRTMIKNTKSENKAEELIATRDGLTRALVQSYDSNRNYLWQLWWIIVRNMNIRF